MSASQRTKGHSFERHVASLLRDIFPEAKRGYQTRGGTKEAPDVDGTPFYIECKKGKRTNIKAAYNQALTATMEYHHANDARIRPPVAITQDDRSHILVTMDFAEWKKLVKDAGAYRKREDWLKELAKAEATRRKNCTHCKGTGQYLDDYGTWQCCGC